MYLPNSPTALVVPLFKPDQQGIAQSRNADVWAAMGKAAAACQTPPASFAPFGPNVVTDVAISQNYLNTVTTLPVVAEALQKAGGAVGLPGSDAPKTTPLNPQPVYLPITRYPASSGDTVGTPWGNSPAALDSCSLSGQLANHPWMLAGLLIATGLGFYGLVREYR